MGAAGLDDEVAAGVSKSSARRLRNRKHSGNESPHFLEPAAIPENQPHNHAMVSNSSTSGRKSNRGRRVNPNHSKSLRRGFTSAIYPPTPPAPISSSPPTASANAKP